MKGSDGGCPNGWILERHLVFREQILSFVMSSHVRCGVSSAASALTSHNAPLVRLLADKWSRGCVVVPGSGMAQVVVGVSKYMLGVTSLSGSGHPRPLSRGWTAPSAWPRASAPVMVLASPMQQPANVRGFPKCTAHLTSDGREVDRGSQPVEGMSPLGGTRGRLRGGGGTGEVKGQGKLGLKIHPLQLNP
ncbi:hypothetical protein Pelo_19458 [Pelomyxa schiedti]|nr:hypothetical protein Pelo_19458 [Pelomyxa schiedti]